ncbi:MAG: hypothetical protein ACRC50_02475 [Gaiella sp.]
MGGEDPLTDALRLGLLGVAVVGLGVVLQLAALGRPRGQAWIGVAGIAPAAGLALTGVVGTALAVTGVGAGVGVVLVGALVAVGLVALGSRRLVRFDRPDAGSRGRPSTTSVVVEGVLLACLGALSVVLFRYLAVMPLADWDGWAIWSFHAHALFVDGDARGPVFEDPLYGGHHPEYPLLLPVLQALVADALGRFDVGLIHLVGAAVPLTLGLGVWGLLRRVVPGPLAALTALGAGWAPVLVDNLRANYADGVVASFVALGLVGLAVWLAGGGGWALACAALFLCAAALTKDEGLLFAVAALLAALAAARPAGRALRPLGVALATVTVPALAFQLARAGSASGGAYDLGALVDPTFLLRRLGRVEQIGRSFADAVEAGWALAVVLVAVALLASLLAGLAWPIVFLGAYLGLAGGGLVATYATATVDLDWLLGTSADRVVFSLALGPALAAPAIVWAALERTIGRAERDAGVASPT